MANSVEGVNHKSDQRPDTEPQPRAPSGATTRIAGAVKARGNSGLLMRKTNTPTHTIAKGSPPMARPQGDPIDDYVVEDRDHVLATFKTQELAIAWARKQGHQPLVARVRHLNDQNAPDH